MGVVADRIEARLSNDGEDVGIGDRSVRLSSLALFSMSSSGEPVAMILPFEMMATVSARNSASSM